MDKEYNILATLRYDPHLATVEAITPLKNEYSTITYSTVNDEFALDSTCNGYKWNPQLIENSKQDFTTFQNDFAEVNKVAATSPPFLDGSLQDKLIANRDHKDFLLSRFLFVPQHVNRINMTLSYFNNNLPQLTLDKLADLLIDTVTEEKKSTTESLDEFKKGEDTQIYKIRVLINKEGKIVTEAHPLPSPRFTDKNRPQSCTEYFQHVLLSGFGDTLNNVWDIVRDSQPLRSTTPFTTFKTTNRSHYTLARERMMEMISKYRYPSEDKTHCEIILHNDNGELMEGSISNIAIRRANGWVTPPLSSGCLCGIFRYYLLQKGYIQEGNISANEISIGDTVLIFNGVFGCIKAIVRE